MLHGALTGRFWAWFVAMYVCQVASWNIINRTTKHPNTGHVTIDEFFEHFSLLNATEGDDSGLESSLSESQTPSNVCNEYSESETLNSPITEDEVSKAVKRLKNGKACGEDYILNEMIKAFHAVRIL